MDELPSFFDLGPRFGDLFAYLVLSLIPGAATFLASFFMKGILLADQESITEVFLLVTGFVLVYPLLVGLWAMGLGATAVFQDFKIPIRIDLHFRAFARCWKSVIGMLFQLFLILIGGGILMTILLEGSNPRNQLIAALPAIGIVSYLFVEGPHLLGLVFRRHRDKLAAIYAR